MESLRFQLEVKRVDMQCGNLMKHLQDMVAEENIEDILAGNKKFNNKDLVACFEKLEGLADAGAFPENMATIEYFDAKQLFNEGQAGMFGTGQWDCAEFDKNIGDKIGFWWGPTFTDTDYEQEIAMKVPSAPIVVVQK